MCSGVILAGGENSRMPVLKGFIEVNGQGILKRNLSILTHLFRNVFIITNEPEAYFSFRVAMVGDVYNTRGPMTGILTALLNSATPWVFISACDMPFINEHLIQYMASRRDNFDAVVPLLEDKTEPLFAFYSRRLILSMERNILEGKKSLKDFLISERVKYISREEILKIDPEGRSFINLNTPDDAEFYLKTDDMKRLNSNLKRRRICSV